MVSGLACSKNLSKMKSPKSNGKPRRNRYCVFKDQRSKSPKMEQSDWRNTSDATIINPKCKVKSGSWKRQPVPRNPPIASTLKTKDPEQASSSSSKFRPGILYSDVLFSGENPSTVVKIRSLTPRQVGSHVQISKSHSRSRKRAINRERASDSNKDIKTNGGTELASLEKGGITKKSQTDLTECIKQLINKEMKTNGGTAAAPLEKESNIPRSSSDLTECIKQLMNRLNIDIPSWNFTDFETLNDSPELVCQFDDYNYLACERVASVGLRLASDGKFKI